MAQQAGRSSAEPDWTRDLRAWLAPFLAELPRVTQRSWAPLYVEGLLGPSERKSVERMAETVAIGDYDQLHHFLTTTAWDPAPLLRRLAQTADALVGGPEAALIIDDTTLLTKGTHSVGVSQQYSGAAGKLTNCQTLVSLTLAHGEVPLPIALRLYLPAAWARDRRRCTAAGVPAEARCHTEKWRLALEEVDRVREAGVHFGVVLADAGYGMCTAFRHELSARGLTWAVGIKNNHQIYPATVRLTWKRRGGGPPRKRPRPLTAPKLLARVAAEDWVWRRVAWRHGTKGRLVAQFAAQRARVGEGPALINGWKVPGEELWLIGERRADGREQFYVSNLPATATLRELATVVKSRWVCEQAHQQLKEELGLDHFEDSVEGRSWAGLHHHALLTMLAFAYLQHHRLRSAHQTSQASARKKNDTTPRPPAARPQSARRPPPHPRGRTHEPRLPMYDLRRTHLPATA